MKLTKIGPNNDPSEISQINMSNSVIMCITENNNSIEFINDGLYLINPSDISFSNQKILINNYTNINYAPNVRWCYPNGININFKEANEFRERNYFSNIYINTLFHIKNEKNTLACYYFNIYVDRSRSKEMSKIKKNEYMLEVLFEQKVFSKTSIENVYLIKNNYCFQEFEQHFSL